MNVQEFIYKSAELENELQLEEKPCKCGLCSKEVSESINLKKVVSGNFTNYEYFQGDRLCKECANLFKNTKSNDMRRSTFIAYESKIDYFKNSELYKKLFEKKKIPFAFCITYSFKKLNSFRAVLNYSNEEYFIRQEDNLINFKTKEAKKIFVLMSKLYLNNFTKKEILTGEYNKTNIQKYGIENFYNIENTLKEFRGKDYFELLTVALPSDLRQTLKKKKEEENAINKTRGNSSKDPVHSVEKYRLFQNESK